MDERSLQLCLGVAASLAALFLILVAIPNWVSAPSNVPNVILSPSFWPYTIAGLTGLIGLGLIIAGLRMVPSDTPVNDPSDAPGKAIQRMIGIAVIMIVMMRLIGPLGLVWTSMLAFLATALLVKTRQPKIALICAVIVPLVLYVFFAHVAGVAIPQGYFIRLP